MPKEEKGKLEKPSAGRRHGMRIASGFVVVE